MLYGLSEKEVLAQREKYGENILPSKEGKSWFLILASQFKSPLIYILLFVLLISVIFREYSDSALIGVVLVVNALMGFFQEYRAHKTLLALKKILKPQTLVIRDGEKKIIEVKDLVPHDLVVLSSGDRIPADGILIESTNLLVNEAILTGEEEAVPKTIDKKNNSLFGGTTVLSGIGILKVEKIGSETQIGKISQSLSAIKEEKTPLQEKLEKFAKDLALIIIVVCLILFVFGVVNHQNFWYMARMSIILVVAAIPEGLPIAITVILTLGVRKILEKKGLVKKLLSVETLGVTSVICTDKTGTLTEGLMKVEKTDFKDENNALLGLTLANDQKSNLETALWELARKNSLDPKEIFNSRPRTYVEPFDSEKKFMMTINEIDGTETAFIKGAPEILLTFCDITKEERQKILEKLDAWAQEGLRILGVVSKSEGNLKEKSGYKWLGLVGIEDPLRPEAKDTILAAKTAGIKTVIVTGDYRKTAERVAKNLGFDLEEENIIEGAELERISEEELRRKIENVFLFTRVTPHQKLKIIKAFQDRGEIVAMTGDGVNDAPALKKADIGIAVGDATDVAKEASDLILLDNNFKTIVDACEEGRLIFSNIKKVVAYVLSNSFAEIFLISGTIFLGLPFPLTVAQILWIHLICDGPPDILLGFEPKDKSLMLDDPKKLREENILGLQTKFITFAVSSTIGLSTLLVFSFLQSTGDLTLARTTSFAILSSASLIYIFSFKNLKKLIFKTENFFKNTLIFWGILYGFTLIFAAIYFPPISKVLGLTQLELKYWFLVLGLGILAVAIVETTKLFAIRKEKIQDFK
jgi:Ca2+-transporting ATPase